MKIFDRICSVILIFAVSIFIISAAQNVIFRTSGVYGFYFNDSRAVNQIYTSLSNNEMAEEIASFMGSWMPEKFDILEFTGYDYESVFTEEDSAIMMKAKKALDISGVLCVVSMVLTISIYLHLLRSEKKKMVMNSYKFSFVISLGLAISETVLMMTNGGRAKLLELINITELPVESQLLKILGPEFINMAAFFVAGLTLVLLAVITYVTVIITKPPRIFY
ncbi:MAG: hypothetical protein IKW01_02295 [Firmicutes bacterium]|nr:hypothetical protein [Bacillota bacterium]